ncbi:MAG: hypothetical protein AABZ33_05165 [Chloroflexota bacterium]
MAVDRGIVDLARGLIARVTGQHDAPLQAPRHGEVGEGMGGVPRAGSCGTESRSLDEADPAGMAVVDRREVKRGG